MLLCTLTPSGAETFILSVQPGKCWHISHATQATPYNRPASHRAPSLQCACTLGALLTGAGKPPAGYCASPICSCSAPCALDLTFGNAFLVLCGLDFTLVKSSLKSSSSSSEYCLQQLEEVQSSKHIQCY